MPKYDSAWLDYTVDDFSVDFDEDVTDRRVLRDDHVMTVTVTTSKIREYVVAPPLSMMREDFVPEQQELHVGRWFIDGSVGIPVALISTPEGS